MITLAFTRPSRRLDASAKEAASMGFDVIAAPSVDIMHGAKEDFDRTREALESGGFDVAIFSSATAAEECSSEWKDDFPRLFRGIDVVAIGPRTSDSLRSYGIEVTSIPPEYTSSGIVDHLSDAPIGKRAVIIHSDHGSPVLNEGLSEAGYIVDELVAYSLDKHRGGLDTIRELALEGRIDVFAFTSRLSVDSFMESIGEPPDRIFSGVRVAAIGEPTRSRLAEHGIHVDIVADGATFKQLLQTIHDFFEKEKRK